MAEIETTSAIDIVRGKFKLYVSAGQRGMQLRLAPQDLIKK